MIADARPPPMERRARTDDPKETRRKLLGLPSAKDVAPRDPSKRFVPPPLMKPGTWEPGRVQERLSAGLARAGVRASEAPRYAASM